MFGKSESADILAIQVALPSLSKKLSLNFSDGSGTPMSSGFSGVNLRRQRFRQAH